MNLEPSDLGGGKGEVSGAMGAGDRGPIMLYPGLGLGAPYCLWALWCLEGAGKLERLFSSQLLYLFMVWDSGLCLNQDLSSPLALRRFAGPRQGFLELVWRPK